MNPLNLDGPTFLLLFGGLFAASLFAAWFIHNSLRTPHDDPSFELDGLGPYEVAYLQGGSRATLGAAVATLAQKGAISVARYSGAISQTGIGQPECDGVEELALTSVSTVKDLAKQKWDTHEPIAEIRRALESRNLILSRDEQKSVGRWTAVAFLPLIALGGMKIAVGVSRGKPVLFLLIACAVALVAAVVALSRKPLRTGRGDRALKELVDRNEALRVSAASNPENLSSCDLVLAAGLFGITAVSLPALDDLQHSWRKLSGSTGSGDSGGMSSGCGGGGGCGGGCGGGGCGGCS